MERAKSAGPQSPDPSPDDTAIGTTLAELRLANAELLLAGVRDQALADRLRGQLAFTAALTDNLGEGVCALDQRGRFTFANPAAERLLGWREGDLLGRDASEMLAISVRDIMQSRTARNADAVFTRRDGTSLDVAYSAAPIVSTRRIVTGAVIAFHDITERKRGEALQQQANEDLEARVRERTAELRAANAELQAELAARERAEADVRERETRLRLVLEQAPAVIWATDADLRLTFAAGTNLASLGLVPDDVVGRLLTELGDLAAGDISQQSESQSLISLPAHRRALGGESTGYLATWRGRSHQVYVEPLRDPDGAIGGTIAIAQDITELSLRRLHDEFIATISHQLLTPLAAARAGLGLLEAGAGDRLGEDERRLLGNIGRNVGRLAIHLNDLLTFDQLKAGTLAVEPVVLDLRGVVADAMGVVHPLLREKGQELAVALAEPLPVSVDAEELTQAVINLLANAHRHTPAGARVAIDGRVAAGEVLLTIADDGPGIPDGAREAIFRRFHRLAAPGGATTGAGLGLAIVRGIVALHGGRVWVEEAPGGGASFRIALPLAAETPE